MSTANYRGLFFIHGLVHYGLTKYPKIQLNPSYDVYEEHIKGLNSDSINDKTRSSYGIPIQCTGSVRRIYYGKPFVKRNLLSPPQKKNLNTVLLKK